MTRKQSTLVTAFTFAAVALVGATLAQASMTINLRLAASAGGGTVRQLTAADVGTNLLVEVWVAVTNELVPAGSAVNGTGTHEGLQFLAYSIVSQSQGGVLGTINTPANRAPYNGPSNTTGAIVDLNGDGILDLGSNAAGSTTDIIRPRTAAANYDDGSGTKAAIPGGTEWNVTRFNFRVDSLAVGGGVTFNPVIPSWILGSVKGANWWQDADYDVSTADGFNNLTYLAGTGVTFKGNIPEPATITLLGLSLVGLVGFARSRRNRG